MKTKKMKIVASIGVAAALALLAAPMAFAAAPCNEPGTVGGGMLGVSPGPVGPPDSLGWDVGSGQCNGSFTITNDVKFPAGVKHGLKGIELALRGEQRRVGPIDNVFGDYTAQTGPDPTQANRAWWNWQASIAYHSPIEYLDALCLDIQTDAGSAVPAASTNLLHIRTAPQVPAIDDRRNQPNPTTEWQDLYQISQNPLFGWLTNGLGGPYNINEEGAWRITLTAWKDKKAASTSICIHTPNADCAPLGQLKKPKRPTCPTSAPFKP